MNEQEEKDYQKLLDILRRTLRGGVATNEDNAFLEYMCDEAVGRAAGELCEGEFYAEYVLAKPVGLAWHYTTKVHYNLIKEAGCLKPSDAHIPAGELPILWCSTNPYWEQTANKGRREKDGSIRTMTMKETALAAGGLVRIAIPLKKLVKWPRIGQQAKMKSKQRKALEEVGISQDADYEEWYGTLESINLTDCVGIESLNMETWEWENITEVLTKK